MCYACGRENGCVSSEKRRRADEKEEKSFAITLKGLCFFSFLLLFDLAWENEGPLLSPHVDSLSLIGDTKTERRNKK